MKLVCMAQCFNENTHKGPDGKTNLKRFLDSIKEYCDSLVLYDDESFDNSVDLVQSYSSSFEDLVIIRGKRNDFKNELAHKQTLLDECRRIGASHVFWLDCDEVIEKRGEQGALRAAALAMQSGGLNFRQVNLWRTDRYYRLDELWDAGLFCRLWRVTDKLHYIVTRGLHQDLAPLGIEGRDTCTLRVVHYGFASTDSILRKYTTYKNHGQSGRALSRLLDESSLRVTPTNESWIKPCGPHKEVYRVPLKEMI